MSNNRKDLYFELKEATAKGISVDPALWERVQKEAEENGWDEPVSLDDDEFIEDDKIFKPYGSGNAIEVGQIKEDDEKETED